VQANHRHKQLSKGQPHQVVNMGRLFPDRRARQAIARVPSIRKFVRPIALPAKFDLRNVNGVNYTAPVIDQGNEGSCTGHGAYAMKGSQERISGTFQEDISRRMIYNDARKRGGLLGQEGAYMIDVMNALVEDGVCREHYWPYVAEGPDKDDWPPPNPDALVDAKNWRVQSFADCMKDEDGSPAKDPVMNIKLALYFEQKPLQVVVYGAVDTGTPWTRSWMDAWASGKMPLPSDNDRLVGGHSWDIIGWDDTKGVFIGQNSWGESNGMGGFFEFPYATLTCRNWQKNGGCEIYKTVDAPSHLCSEGQHYDVDQGTCVDDGGPGPQPDKSCLEKFQEAVAAASSIQDAIDAFSALINCVLSGGAKRRALRALYGATYSLQDYVMAFIAVAATTAYLGMLMVCVIYLTQPAYQVAFDTLLKWGIVPGVIWGFFFGSRVATMAMRHHAKT
jgi:hypothetical protein